MAKIEHLVQSILLIKKKTQLFFIYIKINQNLCKIK